MTNDYFAGPTSKYSIYGDALEYVVAPDCRLKTFAECEVETCKLPHLESGTDWFLRSVGVLTVTAGTKSIEATSPYSEGGDGELWLPGETIGVSFAGGDVPAFADTLLGPAKVVFTSPPLPDDAAYDEQPDPVIIQRDLGLQLAWTGGSDKVQIEISWVHLTGGGSEIRSYARCNFDASAGTGKVPPEALTLLPKTGAEDFTWITADARVEKLVEPGGWWFPLVAKELATNPEGGFVHSAARLE